MRLTTALNEYKRQHDERFPEEMRTTTGAFSGHGDRLVHVSPSGALRDYSDALSGLHGIDRSRFGIETADRTYWFDELDVLRQHYYRGTRLVETEFDADGFTVHQFDLTLGRAHVTHIELRGVVPAESRLVAFLTAAPEGREGRVGALVHEAGGPDGSQALEVFHRREHDYVTASTGLRDVRGQRPERFAEIVDDAPVSFPRGGVEPYDETRLSGNFVVTAPFEREGRGVRTTLVTQLSDHDDIDRETALADLRACATNHESAASLREAAVARTPISVPEDVPRAESVRADLRVVDLLEGPTGGRIAGPEFDPFYANSGGYGYVWFRDDAEVARRLLDAGDRLDIRTGADAVQSALFYCETQLADGTWPHRVWATDGSLAPGWANAKVERKRRSHEYQADQTATVAAFLATVLTERGDALDAPVAAAIRESIGDALDALDDGLAENGLPERCQNAWENAVGQFAHTAATFAEAYATIAAAPVADDVATRAREGATTVLDGLDHLWDAEREHYGMRLIDGDLDDRLDAASLALVEAVVACEDADGIAVSERQLGRLARHVDGALSGLFRDPPGSDVAGVIRYEGDDWRTANQSAPKVWSVATGLGAIAAARLGVLLTERGQGGGGFLERAGGLYELLGADGPFATDAGYLAEQVYDDGTVDSATPLGWAHALRLHATVLLDDADALPAPATEAVTPPERPRWTTGEKHGVCTTADHDAAEPSRVWFTLTEGALTEARFPRIDVMNLRTMDFLVRCREDGHTVRTHTRRGEQTDAVLRRVEPVADDALLYRHVFVADDIGDGHEWTLTVEYAVDTNHDAVVADVSFEAADGATYDVFSVADLSLGDVADDVSGLRVGEAGSYNLLASERATYAADAPDPLLVDEDGEAYSVALALATTGRFDWATVDAAGSDRLADLFDGAIPDAQSSVTDGNVVLVGKVGSGSSVEETVALGFAEEANTAAALGEANGALERGFETVRESYVGTWRSALADVSVPASVRGDYELEAQYDAALMCLLAVEDKTYAGASIASPSVPWGQAVVADEPKGYGYNFVWSRDLYQVFTVFNTVGFHDIAVDQLAYIYEYQQDEAGFIPQNTYVNGTTRWGGEQMDNISFPQVMAYQLREAGFGFDDVPYEYENVRRSADYVARNGPSTAQERWEEESGYSPSSIATEIAGLACAATLADEAGHAADALCWMALADDWAANVESWTATETGTARHAETPYYVRVTRDGDPDAGHYRTLANGGPTLDERDIIDAGFLELVRLGVLQADDPTIENSLAAVDRSIRVEAGSAPGFYRYNGDGYGERATGDQGGPWSAENAGKGRLWPLLSGERAEYELLADALGAGTDVDPADCLRAMQEFANPGRMIAEQVWDREYGTGYDWAFGEGTGSATPLAWAMAQYVRLAHGIDAGEPVETPAVVERRYRDRGLHEAEGPMLDVTTHVQGSELRVSGRTTGARVAIRTPVDAVVVTPSDGEFEATVEATHDGGHVTVAAADDEPLETAATTVHRRTL